jgi:hypothetical protein
MSSFIKIRHVWAKLFHADESAKLKVPLRNFTNVPKTLWVTKEYSTECTFYFTFTSHLRHNFCNMIFKIIQNQGQPHPPPPGPTYLRCGRENNLGKFAISLASSSVQLLRSSLFWDGASVDGWSQTLQNHLSAEGVTGNVPTRRQPTTNLCYVTSLTRDGLWQDLLDNLKWIHVRITTDFLDFILNGRDAA